MAERHLGNMKDTKDMDLVSFMEQWEQENSGAVKREGERKTTKEWLEYDRVPKRAFDKEGKHNFTIYETEPIRTKTAWHRLGKKVQKNARVVTVKRDPVNKTRLWEMFRESDTEPM